MRAFLEQYGIAIFVILIIGIMTLMASGVGATVEGLLKDEIKRFTDKSVSENKKNLEGTVEKNEYGFYFGKKYATEWFNNGMYRGCYIFNKDKTINVFAEISKDFYNENKDLFEAELGISTYEAANAAINQDILGNSDGQVMDAIYEYLYVNVDGMEMYFSNNGKKIYNDEDRTAFHAELVDVVSTTEELIILYDGEKLNTYERDEYGESIKTLNTTYTKDKLIGQRLEAYNNGELVGEWEITKNMVRSWDTTTIIDIEYCKKDEPAPVLAIARYIKFYYGSDGEYPSKGCWIYPGDLEYIFKYPLDTFKLILVIDPTIKPPKEEIDDISNEPELTSVVNSDITGLKEFNKSLVWTDGKETYCSSGNQHYVFKNGELVKKEWKGLTNFYTSNIWSDGTNTYYSYYSSQYVLNGDTWEPKTWSGMTNYHGSDIWTDGTNVYYSSGSTQKVLDGNTWKNKTWEGSLTNFYNSYIWTDGVNTYYSKDTTHYVLNGNKWETKTWSGMTDFDANNGIWSDGTNIYYSNYGSQKILKDGKWETMKWKGGIQYFHEGYTWTDGQDWYVISGLNQYKLNGDTWTQVPYFGLTCFSGIDVWSDGDNTYTTGSVSSYQYKLNGTNWEPITWNNVNSFFGRYVWHDGSKTYFSYSGRNYVFDGNNWSNKTWNGMSSFNGDHVWTDGTNTYYSKGSVHYILDGDTWKEKEWTELTNFDGENVWSTNKFIYYSDGSKQYVLKKGQWIEKEWDENGCTWIQGKNIWSDGNHYYYSDGNSQYILKGKTWEEKTWTGIGSFTGEDVWTDGKNYYYSSGYTQYQFK